MCGSVCLCSALSMRIRGCFGLLFGSDPARHLTNGTGDRGMEEGDAGM